MLSVSVKEFGPIKEGSIALRPLTILIGPNNAGKSYLALLIYALLDPFGHSGLGLRKYLYMAGRSFTPVESHLADNTKSWLIDRSKQEQATPFNEFPNELKEYFRNLVTKFIPEITISINQELQRCFGSELADLVRKGSKDKFRLAVEQDQPPLSLGLLLKDGKLQAEAPKFDFSGQKFDFTPFSISIGARSISVSEEALNLIILTQVFHNFIRSSYYFPAARSGILQVHKVLASVLVSRSPLVGIEETEIPKLSGAVADIISSLLRLEKQRSRPDIPEVAAFLETEVTKGEIDLQANEARFEYPDIYYESDGGKFPLHRTSSMVSELAPIILFLKYVVAKGDLVIIEEPEAHLHPDNQRIFARAIVKLIRMGVQVLITTHSDYFVQQISNFILLSQQVPDERVKLGYSKNDYLAAKEVAAYLFYFDKGKNGSLVKELKVTDEDGIPEDEFVKIAEAIYDETVRLQRLSIRT